MLNIVRRDGGGERDLKRSFNLVCLWNGHVYMSSFWLMIHMISPALHDAYEIPSNRLCFDEFTWIWFSHLFPHHLHFLSSISHHFANLNRSLPPEIDSREATSYFAQFCERKWCAEWSPDLCSIGHNENDVYSSDVRRLHSVSCHQFAFAQFIFICGNENCETFLEFFANEFLFVASTVSRTPQRNHKLCPAKGWMSAPVSGEWVKRFIQPIVTPKAPQRTIDFVTYDGERESRLWKRLP